ncbi:hypothetical protein RclHR1_11240001 [Rhizophagus clarus]|uniref:Uncharacterized protein n=1 Tax=Rhizophagus clarus TaxID=94130 RepID=A0A2Z6QIV5_9GLOM|nr:hypothetical protein RclHR1_11240001 [Rhizophagus clarus]GES84710.1 hypothetical protein RCL_jg25496.t1 [Rhizophagus clarus]
MKLVKYTESNPVNYNANYGTTDYSNSSDKGVTFQDVNKQGKRLIRTFSSDADPVWYKPLAQETNIPNALISLIVYTAPRVYSSILTSQDSLAKIFFLLEKKVRDIVEHGISCANQNLVNSGIPHQDTQQIIFKSVSVDQQSHQNLPVNPDAMQIFLDTDTILPPPSNGTHDAKPNKSKKATLKSIEKVYVNQIIPNDKMNNFKDIFVYDVPASWSYAKIIAKLKA